MTLTTENRNFANLVSQNVDPKHITIDFAANAKDLAEHRKKMDAANPPKPEDPGTELARLEQWGDSIATRLAGSESTLNRAAGRVHGFEKKLADMKAYAKTQPPTAQKPWAEKIADCEADLKEAIRFLEAQKRVNLALVKEKKSFPAGRIPELRKIVSEADKLYKAAKKKVDLGW